ncbi:MAG TPA: hypothetical protein PLD59_03130 [Tepidisphaeraceae bacterium]|nr:hypothetical protein [Tepidisphaeraceae bacterium]
MRNAINQIGLMLMILSAAVIAAQLSAGDAAPIADRPAASVVRFDDFAVGDEVTAVCEPGEFDMTPLNLCGSVLLLDDEMLILKQGDELHRVRRDEVVALYHRQE